jgi:hypothetical protein
VPINIIYTILKLYLPTAHKLATTNIVQYMRPSGMVQMLRLTIDNGHHNLSEGWILIK